MGKKIVRKINGLNLMAKLFLVVSLTSLMSVFMYQGLYNPKMSIAAATGPNLPTTGTNVTGVGTVAWGTPGNITADDTSYATMSVPASATTNRLNATGYGFAIPAGATINGITVNIWRFRSGTTAPYIQDSEVKLIKGGVVQTTNKAATGVDWPATPPAAATYGSAADLWGTTWTATDINNANFGVSLVARNASGANARTASVDYITVSVDYTVAVNSTTAGTATATNGTNSNINVSMPFSDDANNTSTYTVDYKLSSEPITWTNQVSGAAHATSPYTTTITGLTPGNNYDVRVTYVDGDGVTGTNPQTISNIVVTEDRTFAGTATATGASTSTINVSMPFTNDTDNTSTYTVDYKLSTEPTVWTNLVTGAAHATSPYTNTISGLTAATSYDVRFTYIDSDGVVGTNPQTVSGVSTLAATGTNAGTVTATMASASSIDISMPYTGDANGNNTYSYRYRTPSGSGAWSGSTALGHSASPATATITGLTPGSSYDVEMTYLDVNGITGSAIQTVSNIVLPSNATTTGAMSFNTVTSSLIQVQVAFTGDYNASNSCVIKWGTVNGTYPNTITAIRNAGNFTATATGLAPLTNYYFQATFSDGDTVTGTNPVTASTITLTDYNQNDLLHNSDTINKFGTPTNYVTPYGTAGKWGVPTGQYGAFSCATCHTNVKGATTNIKRIVAAVPAGLATIGGRSIKFQNITGSKAGNNGFGDDTASYTTSEKICNVCHTATTAHRFDNSVAGVTDKPNHQGAAKKDCTTCHPHNKGFYAFGDCMNCHSVPQGKRRAIIPQFTGDGNSHHYQGNDFSTKVCYPCHWAAQVDGSLNQANHGGYKKPGARIKLVVYTSATRPGSITASTMVEYSSSVLSGGTRTAAQITQLGNLNNHCLGCHGNGRVKTTNVFNDGKTPTSYSLSAGTGLTVAQRYGTTVGASTGSTSWEKVITNNVVRKTQTKAYNAHNATASNQRGWTTTADTFTPYVNAKARSTVYCFDCHNSHGSSTAASGITTSYSSATGRNKGGILKETVANQGGYGVTYKPTAGGSAADKNSYNAGAALCFNCHMNKNTALETTPWSYNTFGSYSTVIGYWDTKYFGKAGGTFPYSVTYPFKAANNSNKGGHFGKSITPMGSTPTNPINGLCTPCHDPHGVSPALGTNQQYAVPLLRGTWITSHYKQDAPPTSATEVRGGSSKGVATKSVGSTPAYWIDQNINQATRTDGKSANGSEQFWAFGTDAKTLQPNAAAQFAGLCLGCHNQSAINDSANANSGNWKSMKRIHNSVKGWASAAGGNAGNVVHSYTCSKCHTAHNSGLPRLLVSNCLDVKHRLRGTPGTGSVTHINGYVTSGSSSKGSGAGRFPSGGVGRGNGAGMPANAGSATNPGPWFFGDLNVGTQGPLKAGTQAASTCHASPTAGGAYSGTETFNGTTNKQWWNNVTQW